MELSQRLEHDNELLRETLGRSTKVEEGGSTYKVPVIKVFRPGKLIELGGPKLLRVVLNSVEQVS